MQARLTPKLVLASIATAWERSRPVNVPTVYPGMVINTTGWAAWYELNLDGWQERTHRHRGLTLIDLNVSWQAYARVGTVLGRVQQLAERVQRGLAGRTFPIINGDHSERLLVGYLKLGDASVRDWTRVDREGLRGHLRHLTISFRGVVQAIPHGTSSGRDQQASLAITNSSIALTPL